MERSLKEKGRPWLCHGYEPTLALVALLFIGWLLGTIRTHERHFQQTAQALQALHEESDSLELALRGASSETRQWIWTCDSNLHLVNCDPSLAQAFNTTQQGAEGRPISDLLTGSSEASSENGHVEAQIEALIMQLQLHRSIDQITLNVSSGSQPRRLSISAVARKSHTGAFNGYKGVIRALDASTDQRPAPFTSSLSLPDHHWIQPRIEDAIAAAALAEMHCALIQLGIANADAIGSRGGLSALEEIHVQLADTLRSYALDAIPSYIGRSRFLILLPYVASKNDADDQTNMLIKTLDDQFSSMPAPPQFIAGVALSRSGINASVLREHADTAYSAANPVEDARIKVYQMRRPRQVPIAAARSALLPAIKDQLIRPRYDAVFDVKSRSPSYIRLRLQWDNYDLGPIDQETIVSIVEGTEHLKALSEASRVFRRLLFVRRSCDERYKEQVFV